MNPKTPDQWADIMVAHAAMMGATRETFFIQAREIMRECYANAAMVLRARKVSRERDVGCNNHFYEGCAQAIEAEAKRLGL